MSQHGLSKKALHKAMKKDLPDFEKACRDFFNKDLSPKDYKGISGNFGSYAERGFESGMIRLRLPGGSIKPFQYPIIQSMIEEHDVSFIHFTTSQSLQLHHLQAEAIIDIMHKAADSEMYTRGGGGDNPRNVTASPLRGVAPAEFVDVTPYLDEIAHYTLSLLPEVHYPRKLKIGISGVSTNDVHATFRDLGFCAHEDGTFAVYSAGGLGPNPQKGLLMADHVAGEDLLYYVQAMSDTFEACGNFKSRGRARTRYMPLDMGEDAYRTAFQDHLEKAFAEKDLKITYTEPTYSTKGEKDLAAQTSKDGATTSSADTIFQDIPVSQKARIFPQKQKGLYYVFYHPIGGTPARDTFVGLLEALSQMKDTEIRLTMDESAYIINLTAEEAARIAALTDDGARNHFETSVSCVGATVCQIGLQDSNGLLQSIIEAVRQGNVPEGYLPKFHVSGCPSSCGTHQIGSLGFHGNVKLVDKKPQMSFKITVGGDTHIGKETFGEELGHVTIDNIPQMMVDLGHFLAKKGIPFNEYIKTHKEELQRFMTEYV